MLNLEEALLVINVEKEAVLIDDRCAICLASLQRGSYFEVHGIER